MSHWKNNWGYKIDKNMESNERTSYDFFRKVNLETMVGIVNINEYNVEIVDQNNVYWYLLT